jgi:protein gp37
MSANSSIEWTDATWSPLRVRVRPDAAAIARAKGYTSLILIGEKMAGHVGQHCEHVSDGCKLCYSGTIQKRCLPVNGTGLPFDRRSRDLVDPFVNEKTLMQPLKWKQPKRIFVENQSDLFGEWYTDEQIDHVFAMMALSPQHTFQVLTKRPVQMLNYICDQQCTLRSREIADRARVLSQSVRPFRLPDESIFEAKSVATGGAWNISGWPLPNVWLGVSVENQATANERIPLLLRMPAAKRFVSYEPALGPVDFTNIKCVGSGWMNALSGMDADGPGAVNDGLDWVIVGGESGPGARPFDIAWAWNTIAQCREAGVACFVKQLGARPMVTMGDGAPFYLRYEGKGGEMSEWSDDLRVREFPV